MKILIVDDDKSTASYLIKGFKENGFNATAAFDGQAGFDLACENAFACIILDVMLPLKDGFSILKDLRKNNILTPVIMLTAKDALQDKLTGLEFGADDYLVKPFAFSELLARVKAVLRRHNPVAQNTVVKIEDLTIDKVKHKVTRGADNIDLTPKEFNLLCLLADYKDQALSRTFIAEQVWDMNFDSDTNVVDVALRRLRAKVDDNYSLKLISTIRGVGYVLRSGK